MFSARAVNHKINRLHERGLRVLLNDKSSTVNDTLSKSNDATIHVKYIEKLMIELCKYLYGLSAPIMKEVSIKRILKYNLRSCTLPTRYKNLSSLGLFISIIKDWNCSDSPCKICQIFVDDIGFIN